MDIKFIIAMVVALAVVFLLISELNNIRTKIEKKINGIDIIMEKHNDDIKSIFKKETTKITDRYILHTNDMVQQMRKMNSIERQTVMMSDHFVEGDYDVDQEYIDNDNEGEHNQIPYLSDMNQTHCIKRDSHLRDDSGLYMSTTSGTNGAFIIKDDKNNILQSTKVSDAPKKQFSAKNQKCESKNIAMGQVSTKSTGVNSNSTPRIKQTKETKGQSKLGSGPGVGQGVGPGVGPGVGQGVGPGVGQEVGPRNISRDSETKNKMLRLDNTDKYEKPNTTDSPRKIITTCNKEIHGTKQLNITHHGVVPFILPTTSTVIADASLINVTNDVQENAVKCIKHDDLNDVSPAKTISVKQIADHTDDDEKIEDINNTHLSDGDLESSPVNTSNSVNNMDDDEDGDEDDEDEDDEDGDKDDDDNGDDNEDDDEEDDDEEDDDDEDDEDDDDEDDDNGDDDDDNGDGGGGGDDDNGDGDNGDNGGENKNRKEADADRMVNNDDKKPTMDLSPNTISDANIENISKKLQTLKKLQASMQSYDNDDVVSNEITIGSRIKGTSSTVKTGSKKLKNDDISIATIDSSSKKIKGIGSYSKDDLVTMAQNSGLCVTGKMTKQAIYDALKQMI